MSERPVSDDPYRLLGVGRDASAAEVVLAYARRSGELSREDEPALTAARDSVLHDIELRGLLSDHPALDSTQPPDLELTPTRTEPPRSVPTVGRRDDDLAAALSAFAEDAAPEASAAPPSVVDQPTIPAPASVAPADNLNDLWELAVEGNVREAYGRLCAFEQRIPCVDVYLRLYWLLTAAHECDSEREPASWLATGLLADPTSTAMWELYRREMDAHPEEALSQRAAELLRVRCLPETLTGLLSRRWRAAGRRRQWDTIRDDLDALSGPISATERETWALIGITAVEILAWSDDPPARQLAEHCFENLISARSYVEELVEIRDRRNRLRDLTTGWRKIRTNAAVPKALVALIPLAALTPFAEVRPQLLSVLSDLVHSPRELLKSMDALASSHAVLKEVDRLLTELQKSQGVTALDPRSSCDLEELATNFLDPAERTSYRKLRLTVFDFCLQEAISPEILADLIEDHFLYRIILDDRHLSLLLREDAALRAAYHAYCTFWG
jgi:hypothetical protein